jgi:hypothetical protein
MAKTKAVSAPKGTLVLVGPRRVKTANLTRRQTMGGASNPGRKKMKQVRKGRSIALGNARRAMTGVKGKWSAEARALALAISIPSEYPNLRLPTEDAPRTSIITLRDQLTITGPAAATVPNWNAGDLLFAVYGHPSRLAMVGATIPSVASYVCYFPQPTGAPYTAWILSPTYEATGTLVQAIDELPWPLLAAPHFSGSTPHGATMPAGVSNGLSYLLCNPGDTLQIQTPGNSWTGNLVFTLRRWVSSDSPPVDVTEIPLAVAITTTSATVVPVTAAALTTAGHYSLVCTGLQFSTGVAAATTVNVYLTSASSGPYWSIVHMGDLDPSGGDPLLGADTRMNGFSFLATNTTSFLNRQGTVLAARIKNTDFPLVTPTNLARISEKYTDGADKGVYTYLEFSSDREKFTHASPLGYPQYPLDVTDYYHFIQITCPGTTTPNTFTCSFDSSIEFKTDSARYVKSVSPYSFTALVEARRLCNETPDWFYENPLHWRDIVTRITSGARMAYGAAKTYGPSILSTAARSYPANSSALLAAGSLLRALG